MTKSVPAWEMTWCEWRLADGHVANLDRLADGPRTGQILTLPVSVPSVGRP
jgi:hypothetical protein